MESTGSPSPDPRLRRGPYPRESPRKRPVRPVQSARSLRLQRSILSLGSFFPCLLLSLVVISRVPPDQLPGGLRHIPGSNRITTIRGEVGVEQGPGRPIV